LTSIAQQLKTLARRLDAVLPVDRAYARREIGRIRKAAQGNDNSPKLLGRCERLAQRLAASESTRRARLDHRPVLAVDPHLPISAKSKELIEAIRKHQVMIVAGETGSGKTTQLPKFCLAAGRGIDGWIGLTQPRRIAATTVSRRIAEELNEEIGQSVGYKIRFQDKVGARTRIKVMTDGILLAEAHGDGYLDAYDTLIIDEAHERSLNIDFILGIVKQLLAKRRDLKVIITSATIDTDKFARAFDHAPVIEVSGRMYPVETRWMAPDEEEANPIEGAVEAVDRIVQERRHGDILVFMPTEQDIRDTCEMLKGRQLPATTVIPLFARLSSAEQKKVFRTTKGRKIVVSTNVAETSLTIPGINIVVDTGLARISQYTPRSRTTTLPVTVISQSSADQRQGRCGRTANGICIRLYSEEDYHRRPRYTAPEILRANLAEVILRMIALRLGAVEDFPFIDPPAPKSIQDGYQLLLELGAIVSKKGKMAGPDRYRLTDKGRLMSRLPLDPRLSCMLLEARSRGCLDDLMIIAAALSIQDPRERPAIRKAEADQAQARFVNPASDFLTLHNLWHAYQAVVQRRRSWSQVKAFCYEHFLSFRRMREWQDVCRQIRRVLADQRIGTQPSAQPLDPQTGMESSRYAAIHQSILCGFLSNVAMKKEKQIFLASHNRQVMIFPGSGLFKNPGQWIVSAEMVETSRLFARCGAGIDPAWIEPIAKTQCKYTYLDPHWERKRGQVIATEQVSLYGLIIDRRPRPYGPVNPKEAADIFIRKALIDMDVQQALPFMTHNTKIIDRIEDMENRLRRRDIRMGDEDLVIYYQERIGAACDLRSLKRLIKKKGGDRFLRLTEKDLLLDRPGDPELALYPDRIAMGSKEIEVDYQYLPGEDVDGVTAKFPARMTRRIDTQALQWLVPGLLEEKITALIKTLPKSYRKKLVPVAQTVGVIMAKMPMERENSLANSLSCFIKEQFGVDIPSTAWDERLLPEHLRMRLALTDDHGMVIKSGRDSAVLGLEDIGYPISSGFDEEKQKWERSPIESWDFGDLPDTVALSSPTGRKWTTVPALQERGEALALTLFADEDQAEAAHSRGVRHLLMRRFNQDVKYLRRNLRLPHSSDSAARYFGGRKALEDQITSQVVDDLMLKNIRTAEGFQAHIQKLERAGIPGRGRTKLKRVADLLLVYAALRIQLHQLEKTHAHKRPVLKFVEALRDHLNTLVPKSFIRLYDNARLKRLLRYLQAMSLRAERGLVNLEKDRVKSREVAAFTNQLDRIIQSLSPQSSREKRRAVEDFFWMLEEYKISVFAQEIKTVRPVSAKRLAARIGEIEAMV
jgi:ATP-dependent helicase HrpA